MLKLCAQRIGQAHRSFIFHPLQLPGLQVAVHGMVPALAPSPAGAWYGMLVGGAGTILPFAGAGAAGACGGAGCAGLLQGQSKRSPEALSKPTMSP